ncbi:MAG: flagellar motor protein MotB [Rhodocyclaceae bacterium]|jgi:chemotaxis protein MotB|nr:flagellar motor protein MotB [Rhodocyclaceae bacterium]MCA3074625.1 flagellar motor protein MotB [Rhodocyclaceae bacterium]MCA3088902.1 flagellar motor protein MotB [Rhodocyclaceae bacterium]MCA3095638.1 flagellar motor protein MotB [Rhodocyclaceae bacterium]MCA3097645.1 flagellar motor protein MotB [Rhodocyclaceae bacterium]
MAEESQRPIVVKRIKKGGHGKHGGAWKIAYADFVTAMMAFFLLMWLLGSVSKGDLKGISDYFNTPLKTALMGGSSTGEAQSVIPGGGTDLTASAGQVHKGESEPRPRDERELEAELEAREAARLAELKEKIEKAIEANPLLAPFRKQLLVDLTPEGLRIQIVDEQNRPMFPTGSSNLASYTRDLLREIGIILNDVPNRVSLSGHTDAASFGSGDRGFSNWELSAERANSARREMIAGGMADAKVLRVVGLASAVGFPGAAPLDAVNRRISIIVLNRKTEKAITAESAASPAAPPPASSGAAPAVSPGR